MMPRMSWSIALAARSTSTPLMSGILMSEMSRSNGSRSSAATRLPAVLGQQHVVALAPQHDRQQLAHRPLVVDDEDAGAARGLFSAAHRLRPSCWQAPGQAVGRALRLAVSCLHSPCSRHRLIRRQPHRHRRPGAGLRGHLDLATVVADDAVHDRQAEAGASAEPRRGTAGTGRRARPAGCRRPRRAPAARRRPAPGAGARVPRLRATRQRQPPAVRHRPQAVGREVPDDLPDLPLVGLAHRPRASGASTSHVVARSRPRRCCAAAAPCRAAAGPTSTGPIAKRCGRA